MFIVSCSLEKLKIAMPVLMFCISTFFSTSVVASYVYGPITTPPSNYVRVECHEVIWRIGTVSFGTGENYYLTKRVEICTYFDADGDVVGYSTTVMD